ncbi:MAG: hypothetical protein IPL54_04120 [Chitinophagaceae bacterium]|nr:hypothetical protein [Chitinophagaceae bacterium]
MKPITLLIAVLCCPVFAFCQDITGLWKGTMYNDSTKQVLEYEIVIRKEKGKFTGYSHSSYLMGTTKYYGVKKINVRVAKDGKIVMQDAKWLENNYPGEQSKNVIQLNVLDLAKSGEESYMDGLFVTNRSRAYNALTGRMSIKRVNSLVAHSELMNYLQMNTANEILTVVK